MKWTFPLKQITFCLNLFSAHTHTHSDHMSESMWTRNREQTNTQAHFQESCRKRWLLVNESYLTPLDWTMSTVRLLLPVYVFFPSVSLSCSSLLQFFLRLNFDGWLSSAKRISLVAMMRRMLIIIICEWTDERWMSAVMEATTLRPANPPQHSHTNYST